MKRIADLEPVDREPRNGLVTLYDAEGRVVGYVDPGTRVQRHLEGGEAMCNEDRSSGVDRYPDHLGRAQTDTISSLRSVPVEIDVTAKNDAVAAGNRSWFESRGLLALNLVSSPGAGKTTLLERTLRDLGGEWPWAVVEGDQQTDHDARRIAACGVPVVQINTGSMCHLDAQMVRDACQKLDPPAGAVVLIENVGNLICPALFDLGEAAKVVIASVAEGDDKPAKYPYMFQAASLVILNKCDLLPYVPFDPHRFELTAHQVNPAAPVIQVSATRGDRLAAWYRWLRERRASTITPRGPHGAGAALHAAGGNQIKGSGG